MSAPSTLAEVAQDYSEFHVSVEAHNPGKREAQRLIGARVIRRVSSSVDFRRFASLGRAEDEETPSQKKGKNESDRLENEKGTAALGKSHLKSETSQQIIEKKEGDGQEKSVAAQTFGDRKSRASTGCQQRDQHSTISAHGLRRKLSEKIGLKRSSSGIHSVNVVNTPKQQSIHGKEPKEPLSSTTSGQSRVFSKPNTIRLASEAGSLVKKFSKNFNLKGVQKTEVLTENMPMDSSPVSESSDRARQHSCKGQTSENKSKKAEPRPREKSEASHGSRLLKKVSSAFSMKQNR